MGINLVFTMILAFLGKSVYQGGVFIYSGDKLINVFKKRLNLGNIMLDEYKNLVATLMYKTFILINKSIEIVHSV